MRNEIREKSGCLLTGGVDLRLGGGGGVPALVQRLVYSSPFLGSRPWGSTGSTSDRT